MGVITHCVHIQIATGHTILNGSLSLVSLATKFYLLDSDMSSTSTCQFVINFYCNEIILDNRKSVLYLVVYLDIICYNHFKLCDV